ncbi:TPA: hypothetical protein EYN09_21440 [Candidatus Poribacteria bacterium]|nr:hypothetical protein [Candidatus Poribacteria bacterium]
MPFQAGAAKINVTPHLGCQMAGYASRDQGSQTITDALYSKAIVLDDGNQQVAIITNDLIGVAAEFVADVRRQIEYATSIPQRNIMISCSHTHFGPETRQSDLITNNEHIIGNGKYIHHLAERMTTVVEIAQQNLQPARIGYGSGMVDNVSFNRHTIQPDGTAKTSFLLPPPDTDLTFGLSDPKLNIIRIEDPNQKTIATLVHFACHPVTSTDKMYAISADYPGYVMNLIEGVEGGVTLFGLGCAGNLVPIQRQKAFPRLIGHTIGAEALKVLQWINTTCDIRIQTHTKSVELTRRETGEVGDVEKIEIQCINIGGIYFVGLPGEIFTEIGLNIASKSGIEKLLLISMTNGSYGYFPTMIAYEQGGYESGVSQFQADCGETLTEVVTEMIREV